MRVIKIDGREYTIVINARAEKLFKSVTGKWLFEVAQDLESLLSMATVSAAFWALCSSTGKIDKTIDDFDLLDISEFANAAPDVVAEVKEKIDGFSGAGGPLERIIEIARSVMERAATLAGGLSGRLGEEGSESPEASTSTASSGT